MKAGAQQKMREIASVLSGAAAGYQAKHGGALPPGACLHEPLDRRTPFDELAEKEDRMGGLPLFEGTVATEEEPRQTPFEELAAREGAAAAESPEAVLIWLEANAWLLDFLFAEGPHPATVMRRLFAWVKKFRPEAIWDMGYRQLGTLLDESHGAMEWRIGVLLDDFAKARGVNGVKAPWQRTAEACGAYSEAQQGNANRNGGKRSGKSKINGSKL